VISWSLTPCVLWHQCGSYCLELAVFEDALWAALDVDCVAGIEECLGGGGSEGGAVLEWLAYAVSAIDLGHAIGKGAYTRSADEE